MDHSDISSGHSEVLPWYFNIVRIYNTATIKKYIYTITIPVKVPATVVTLELTGLTVTPGSVAAVTAATCRLLLLCMLAMYTLVPLDL